MKVFNFQPLDVNALPVEFGIYQELVDHDLEISMLSHPPIIINDIDHRSLAGKERLNSLLITSYDGDSLPILPSCDCGALTSQQRVGQVCPDCGHPVVAATEKPIESNVWIRAPEGVRALINPAWWAIMSGVMTVSSVNILEWLTNPAYRPPKNIYPVEVLKSKGVVRSLNYFYDHFDSLMETLFTGKTISSITGDVKLNILRFIGENRQKIFCQYIPIPNKLAFIMETSSTGIYSDTTTASAIDAARSIASIYAPVLPVSQQIKENRTVKAISQLAAYYREQFRVNLSPKSGWFRKHGVGSKQCWSIRAVISSITRPHHHEELELPWGVGIALSHVHLAGALWRQGLTPNAIEECIHYSTIHYDPEIHQIVETMRAQALGLGPGVIIQRNPTLSSKSAQLLQWSKLKADTDDVTMGVSVLCLPAWNADFDGKALPSLVSSVSLTAPIKCF